MIFHSSRSGGGILSTVGFLFTVWIYKSYTVISVERFPYKLSTSRPGGGVYKYIKFRKNERESEKTRQT